MVFKHVFKGLDNIFKNFSGVNLTREFEYYPLRNKVEGIKDVLYDMDILDSKSSALLTHISVMFVALGFFIVDSNNHRIIQSLLVTEFIIYLVIAMLLLRCIDIMGPPFRKPPNHASEEDLKAMYYFEVTLRREIYARSLRIVYTLTALLVPIILLKYILLLF